MKKVLLLSVFLSFFILNSQESIDNTLTLSEYLAYVKKFHPIVKQAQLKTTEGEIKLLKARGAFDPKLEVDYDKKEFKKTEYFNKLNATFKIPTWYGVEFKGNYQKNSGTYLNPELTVPDDGLYSAGVSVSLAKGLWINKRMAALKQAKLYTKQLQASQQLLINDIMFDAIYIYLDWLKNYQIKQTYERYLVNAQERLDNVKKSFFAGDKPAVDTLEANINLKSRKLDLEKSRIKYVKSRLELANYLWLEGNIPLELQESILPDTKTIVKIEELLDVKNMNIDRAMVENHPKIQSLQFKKQALLVNKRLKVNNLLPQIDAEYNFLSAKTKDLIDFNTNDYKMGINVKIPIFLRKERSELRLAKLKLRDIDFSISSNKVNLENKIKATVNEVESYKKQNKMLNDLVFDYQTLVKAEERKFTLGEGSLFRINYREVKLIETKIKTSDSEFKTMKSIANYFRLSQGFVN